jgi:hypothetical protein
MRSARLLMYVALLMFILSAARVVKTSGQGPITRQISIAGSTSIPQASVGSDAIQDPELDPAISLGDSDSVDLAGLGSGQTVMNRTVAKGQGQGQEQAESPKAKSNPELVLSFTGLNHRDQRLANNGNQFSVEPPDQGLCAGNGFVLETVNDVMRVFDTSGNALTGAVDLNTFYGYAPAIVRPSTFGPSITDPSCYFDPDTQRWFHLALTLDRVGTKSRLAGTNHLDVAVSTTSSPLGAWNIYRLPVQDDGTQGTPNHLCPGGPCLGDYPHIGADANGIYITTNEFALFRPGFIGAQIYALSKRALAAGAANVNLVQFNTADPNLGVLLDGTPGFTVWPAISPKGDDAAEEAGDRHSESRGTEFFMSSQAVFNSNGADSRIRVWSLRNTASLDSALPALSLSASVVDTIPYAVPPRSGQQAGDFPQGQCLANAGISTPFGLGCWRFFLGSGGPFPNTEKVIESNDSRMQQVVFANGKLWGALDTAVVMNGQDRAGIAYFVINPFSGRVLQQGVVAVANNNVTYPAVGVTPSGRGVMAFTLVGADHYPSAAYTSLDAKIGAGPIHIANEGAGPDDGFTGYNPTAAYGTRSRWGDYGAAATDGDSIWFASEDIEQTCSLLTYVSDFSCGASRTSLANWATHITQVTTK